MQTWTALALKSGYDTVLLQLQNPFNNCLQIMCQPFKRTYHGGVIKVNSQILHMLELRFNPSLSDPTVSLLESTLWDLRMMMPWRDFTVHLPQRRRVKGISSGLILPRFKPQQVVTVDKDKLISPCFCFPIRDSW